MTALSIALGLFIIKIGSEVSKAERQRLAVAVYFTLLATLFWAIFEQAGSSITLFADRNVNLTFLNASQTNSINSFYIIALAIPFSILWTFLSKINKNPNTPIKFGLGLIFLGIGFLCFAFSATMADELAKTPMFYLLLGYFIYTVGEMFISPIGLSKITELSPIKYASFMMGVWFLSSSYGHFFAGKIAQFTTAKNEGAVWFQQNFTGEIIEWITGLTYEGTQEMEAVFQQLYAYVSTYAIVGLFSISVGFFALLISPFIKKLMNGAH
jgi:POT family proton-dependent oligopeptide transporter